MRYLPCLMVEINVNGVILRQINDQSQLKGNSYCFNVWWPWMLDGFQLILPFNEINCTINRMNSSRVGFSAKATFIVVDLGLVSDII